MLITNLQDKLGALYRVGVAVPPAVLVREPVHGQRGRWCHVRVDVGRRDTYQSQRGLRQARTLYHVRYGLDAFRFQHTSVADEMQADPLFIAHQADIVAAIHAAIEAGRFSPSDCWE